MFTTAVSAVVFGMIFNFGSAGAQTPAQEPSGPYSPPSTHVIQNRDDRESRATDQNRLFFGPGTTGNPSNTNSLVAPATPSSQVPSGTSVTAPSQTTTTEPDLSTGGGVNNSTERGSLTARQEADFQALLPTMTSDLPVKRITRTQAIAQALSQNFDIKIKAYDEEAAQALVRQGRGIYDPVFNVEASYEDIDDPQNTQDFVATGGTPEDLADGRPRIFQEQNEHYKIALDGKLPYGTQYELKTQMDVLANTLDRTSPLSLFTPEYQSFTGITIDQPLLRGFGKAVNNSQIDAAIVNKLAARYDVEDQMLSTVSQVMQSYYQLSFLTAELEAKRQDRDLGIKLVRERFLGLEKGRTSARDVNLSESTLAEIIEDYTKAQNLQALVSNDLNQAAQFIYSPITTMTIPELHQTADQLIALALMHRPKYLEAKERVAEQNIRMVFAQNAKWPQLDLKGTYGINGLSGSLGNSYYREIVPEGPQYSVGISFSVPIGNNDAEGKIDEIAARKQQALVAMKQVEMDTNLLIRKLVETIRSDENRLKAMDVFSQTAANNLDQEQERLEKGLSTDLDVMKYRRDSTEARARKLAALADLNSAYVQLQEITGTLLDSFNIHVHD
jgi:outer membrane protein